MVLAPGGAGPQGRVRELLEQMRLEGYSRARVDGELRRLDEEIDARQEVQARHLDRRRPARDEAGPAPPPLGVGRGGRRRSPVAWSRSSFVERRRAATRRRCCSRRFRLPRAAAPRSPSWSRGSSPSTRRTAPASAATDSASSGSSTPIWSSPTRRSRSRKARCSLAPRRTRATGERLVEAVAEDVRRRHRHALAGAAARQTASSSSTAPARERHKVSYRNRFGRSRSYTVRFEGIVNNLERRYEETDSERVRERIEGYMAEQPCPDCDGARLRPESLAVKVGGIEHRRVHASCRRARAAEWIDDARDDRDRARDRAPDRARDRRAARLPRERRHRLPVAGPLGAHALGRRGAADPAGDPDRLQPGRRDVHPRRALDRPAPARQREADRHPASACATSATR